MQVEHTDGPEARVARSWERCKDWITEWDGAATETALPNVSYSALAAGLESLAQPASTFGLEPVSWQEDADESLFSPPPSAREQVRLLEHGPLSTIRASYTVVLRTFEFSAAILIDRGDPGFADLDVIWWADAAFPPGSDHRQRFEVIFEHFLWLQALFGAPRIYVAPENCEPVGPDSGIWTEV